MQEDTSYAKRSFVLQKGIAMFEFQISFEGTCRMLTFLYHCKQGFGREKDGNRASLCLRSIIFCFESRCL